MRFEEAMAELRMGKKVRRNTWNKEEYIVLFGDHLRDECGTLYDLDAASFSYTWELYEEKEEELCMGDVLDGLIEGKKYRRKTWAPGDFIQKSLGNLIIFTSITNSISTYFYARIYDLQACDWVEVK
jgi:hypothetical protein